MVGGDSVVLLSKKEVKNLIQQGEGQQVEFKKSNISLTRDIYETISAFSN